MIKLRTNLNGYFKYLSFLNEMLVKAEKSCVIKSKLKEHVLHILCKVKEMRHTSRHLD
jgi:hypothetical protein